MLLKRDKEKDDSCSPFYKYYNFFNIRIILELLIMNYFNNKSNRLMIVLIH